ncbi:MAG: hydantoinase B/oxoprolinase family protein, partial [Desulfuromusa sp.]|nr:hydantoinase B/oxoprolinase family protein [Desulfuromusa sp.]
MLPPLWFVWWVPGKVGNNLIYRNSQKQQMPGKFSEQLNEGDIIRIETPGGGGYGTT